MECDDFESEGCEGANDDMLPPLEPEEGSCLVDEDVRLPTETPTEFPTVDPTVDPVRIDGTAVICSLFGRYSISSFA